MWTRRGITEAVGAGSIALLAGCLGGSDDGNGGNDEEDNESDYGYETHLDELDEYDPVDLTDQSSVDITVAPDGAQRFDPDAFMIEKMTRVTWRWGESGYEIYPIEAPDPCQWDGSDGGTNHAWEFPFVGKYVIGCTTPAGEEFTGIMFVVEPDS